MHCLQSALTACGRALSFPRGLLALGRPCGRICTGSPLRALRLSQDLRRLASGFASPRKQQSGRSSPGARPLSSGSQRRPSGRAPDERSLAWPGGGERGRRRGRAGSFRRGRAGRGRRRGAGRGAGPGPQRPQPSGVQAPPPRAAVRAGASPPWP